MVQKSIQNYKSILLHHHILLLLKVVWYNPILQIPHYQPNLNTPSLVMLSVLPCHPQYM